MSYRSARVVLAALAASLALAVMPARAEDPSQRMAALYEEAAREGEVVYLTASRDTANRKLSETWRQRFPKVRLNLLRKQAPEMAQVIGAEALTGRFRTDVFHITLPYVVEIWKRKGWLEPYKPAVYDALDARFKDPDGAYVVSNVYLMFSAYNSDLVKDAPVLPKRLADYLDPRWKGKILMADPATAGSSRTFFMGMLLAGKIDWDYLARLAEQDLLFVRATSEAARLLGAGERPLALSLSWVNIIAAREKGQPIGYYAPEEGALVNEMPTGILKSPPHPAAARLLDEFLCSPEGQELLSEGGEAWPTHPQARAAPGVPRLQDFTLLKVSLQALADEAAGEAFVERFNKVFGRK